MGIKCRVYNKVRKALYKKRLEDFTPTEKEAFFDQLFADNHEAHWELINYKDKRRKKAILETERRRRQPEKENKRKERVLRIYENVCERVHNFRVEMANRELTRQEQMQYEGLLDMQERYLQAYQESRSAVPA